MAVNLQLVPATAGKRLGAAVTDWLFPLVVPAVLFSIGFAGVTRTRSGGFITYDTGSVVLFGGIGTGLALVYLFVLLGLEARTGKTPGNLLLGIRSADNDGYAPGAGPVFLRSIITGAGAVLVLIAAVLVVVFKWFDAALLILGPLQLLAAVWAVLVVISNRWDKNGGVRGWHDAAAKTLVFDVKAGRNPITSGGIQGPYSFAPLDLPPVQQVQSPVAGVRPASGAVVQAPAAPTAQPQPPLAQPAASRPAQPAASQPAAPIQPAASQPAAPVQPAPFAPAGPTPPQPRRAATAQPGAASRATRTTTSNAPKSGPAPRPPVPQPPHPRRSCGSGSTTAGTSSWTGTSWWDATRWVRPANSMPSCWPWTIPAAPFPKPTCTS